MGGEVGDEEVDGLGGTESVDLTQRLTQREALRMDCLPKTGVGERLAPTDYSDLIRITPGILLKIVDEHHFSESLDSTRATRLSSERRLRGVASVASRVMP